MIHRVIASTTPGRQTQEKYLRIEVSHEGAHPFNFWAGES